MLNAQNIKLAYYINYFTNSNRILQSDKDHQKIFVGDINTRKTNSNRDRKLVPV